MDECSHCMVVESSLSQMEDRYYEERAVKEKLAAMLLDAQLLLKRYRKRIDLYPKRHRDEAMERYADALEKHLESTDIQEALKEARNALLLHRKRRRRLRPHG